MKCSNEAPKLLNQAWIWREVAIENPGNTFQSYHLPQRESFVTTERQRGYWVSPFRVPRRILALKTMTSSKFFRRVLHFCTFLQISLHLWPNSEWKRRSRKSSVKDGLWREAGRSAEILRREVFLSTGWFHPPTRNPSICSLWNDLYMTLVGVGGNAKPTHMQQQTQGAVGYNRKFLYSLSAD